MTTFWKYFFDKDSCEPTTNPQDYESEQLCREKEMIYAKCVKTPGSYGNCFPSGDSSNYKRMYDCRNHCLSNWIVCDDDNECKPLTKPAQYFDKSRAYKETNKLYVSIGSCQKSCGKKNIPPTNPNIDYPEPQNPVNPYPTNPNVNSNYKSSGWGVLFVLLFLIAIIVLAIASFFQRIRTPMYIHADF